MIIKNVLGAFPGRLYLISAAALDVLKEPGVCFVLFSSEQKQDNAKLKFVSMLTQVEFESCK